MLVFFLFHNEEYILYPEEDDEIGESVDFLKDFDAFQDDDLEFSNCSYNETKQCR